MLVKVMGVMELCVILPVILFFLGGGGGGVRVWGLGFRVFFKKTNKLDIPTKSLIPEPLPLKP